MARRLIGFLAVFVLVAPSGGIAQGGRSRNACTGEATLTLIRSFARNYSAGRVATINRMWAPAPRFKWFSSGKPGVRLGPAAYVRSTLASYFRSRIRVHERIRITYLRTPRYEPARKIVNFSGKLARSADDMRPRGPTDFKGAADCVSGRPTLIVWSM
jgi:hypothetical protein